MTNPHQIAFNTTFRNWRIRYNELAQAFHEAGLMTPVINWREELHEGDPNVDKNNILEWLVGSAASDNISTTFPKTFTMLSGSLGAATFDDLKENVNEDFTIEFEGDPICVVNILNLDQLTSNSFDITFVVKSYNISNIDTHFNGVFPPDFTGAFTLQGPGGFSWDISGKTYTTTSTYNENFSVALSPTGVGGLSVHDIDSGFHAVDLQTHRSDNDQIASGNFSVVLGGRDNKASKSYSLAAGRSSEAIHHGSFVVSDSRPDVVESTQENELVLSFENGASLNGHKVLSEEDETYNGGTVLSLNPTPPLNSSHGQNNNSISLRDDGVLPGPKSIDLQYDRTSNDQIPAGHRSSIIGGRNNTIKTYFGGTNGVRECSILGSDSCEIEAVSTTPNADGWSRLSFIHGSVNSKIEASLNSAIVSGVDCTITNSSRSLAIGRNIDITHSGTKVFTDGLSRTSAPSTESNRLDLYFNNGLRLAPTTTGAPANIIVAGPGGGIVVTSPNGNITRVIGINNSGAVESRPL